MKKGILWIAILLVALIPTYILIFQAFKYDPPTVKLNGTTLDPTYYKWENDGNGDQPVVFVPDEEDVREDFAEAVTVLSSVNDLKKLTFSKKLDKAMLRMENLETKEKVDMEYTSFRDGKVSYTPTHKTQITLSIMCDFAGEEQYYAMYSFEVTP